MPRAAMSVATRTGYLPDLNPASACVRWPWERLPWIRSALIPFFTRNSVRRLVRCFVRVNTSACLIWPVLSRWTRSERLTSCEAGYTACVIPDAGVAVRAR